MQVDDQRELDELDLRLRVLLPETYQDSYENLEPTPMGSAGLKFGPDGRVAWDQIWGSFCNLAMAGGPPHKGRLLEPGHVLAIDAAPERYEAVVEEICRGIMLASELPAQPSSTPGWVSVDCYSETMASWLLRAIVMENVSARSRGRELLLPAAPDFHVEKEIKNVITVIAKTTHYWMSHMSRAQKSAIADLFAKMSAMSPLIEPPYDDGPAHRSSNDDGPAHRSSNGDGLAHRSSNDDGLAHRSFSGGGWSSVDCPGVKAAVWMMRGMVVHNVLARREETTLLVAKNPATDPNGVIVARTVMLVHRLAAMRGLDK